MARQRRTLRSALCLAACGALALPAAAPASSSEDVALVARSYTIESGPGPIKVKAGARGAARFAVVPRPGAHVSPDAPITVTAAAGPALELPKLKLTRADSRPTPQQGVELEIPFHARSAGADEIKASFVFYICLKDLCERQKKDLAFAVAVE